MSIKILSVDDETDLELLLSQYFRRKIRNGEYEFFFAHNGLEALQVLLKHPDISIILSDINMPEMDGLTLLAKINEMRIPSLKCIMVSAYGDMDNIRQAMNGGAFDFATKPIDLDDLQRTIDKAVEQIEYIRSAQKEHAQLVDIQTDLSVAREIQHAILPRTFDLKLPDADNVNIYASMLAAKDVGGDFYDFFPIDDHRIAFTIADVSGKGVPAAIFMAVSRTLLRATGIKGANPAECVTYSNELLAKESVKNMFVTIFYGIYNIKTGDITYTNAGHNPPYILKANGNVETLPMSNNIIVGVFDDFNFSEETCHLDKGDTIVLFTDGVTEAIDIAEKEYGDDRLKDCLAKHSGNSCQQIIDAIKADVSEFVGEAEQSDDITMLALKRK